MAAGALFAREVETVLAWVAANLTVATAVLIAIVAAYVAVKAVTRWRVARIVVGAMISAEELRGALAGSSPPIVIDVGSHLAHSARPHIPGALSLDLDGVARYAGLPPDRDIVLYCACPNEESSRRAAGILVRRGFTRARALAGGIEAWSAHGYPVEPGIPVEVRVPVPKITPRS